MTKRSKARKKVKSITHEEYGKMLADAMLDEVYERYFSASNWSLDQLKSTKHTKPLKLKKRGLKRHLNNK